MIEPSTLEPLTLSDLRQLSPQRFENLIGQLVQAMGYRANVTQHSQDGGIDVIASQTDGLTANRVLIQAKRYTGTVGVSTIRDLYGVLSADPTATAAVVITTGNYSTQAREFAEGKRLQLIDGPALLKLLAQYDIADVSPPITQRTITVGPASLNLKQWIILVVLALITIACTCCLIVVAGDIFVREIGLLPTYTPAP